MMKRKRGIFNAGAQRKQGRQDFWGFSSVPRGYCARIFPLTIATVGPHGQSGGLSHNREAVSLFDFTRNLGYI
jgi:hypothetical protein